MAISPKLTRAQLLLTGAAVLFAAPALAGPLVFSTNYAFSGTQDLGSYGAGQQQIGTSFGGSAGFGSVSRGSCVSLGPLGTICTGDYGADAQVSASGNVGLSVDTSFSGSQATLNYGGTSKATLNALGGGYYSLGVNVGSTSQSFTDTGAVASLAIGGSFGLQAAASGEVCVYSCTGGGGTLFNVNAGGNILSVNNGGSGSLKVFGVGVPGLVLDKQKSVDVVNVTLNSVGATASGTSSVSVTNPVLAASVDLVKVAAKLADLPKTSVSVDLGIGSATLSIGSVNLGVGLGLTRGDTANVGFSQTLSFSNRQTGQAEAVPVEYTTDKYTFHPNAITYQGRFCSSQPFQGDSSDTHLTGSAGSGPNGPQECFSETSSNFTQLKSSVSANAGSLNLQVGDGSFDFSQVKIRSSTTVDGQVSSQRSLAIAGTVDIALGTGNLNLSLLGYGLNDNFGPLASKNITFAQTSVDLGTHSTAFGTTQTVKNFGFDGAVGRAATASVSPGVINLGATRVGGTLNSTITVTNTASNDGFSEGLYYSKTTTGSVSADPRTYALAAGSSGTIAVKLDTSHSGVLAGTVGVALQSDGSQTGHVSYLGARTVTVNGNVYAPAVATVSGVSGTTGTINVTARVGDQVTRNISITNSASGALTDSLLTTADRLGIRPLGAVPGPLAAGQTGTIAFNVDTHVAGANQFDFLRLKFASHDPQLADLALGGQQVLFFNKIYAPAVASVAQTLDFGVVRVGDQATRNIVIANTAVGGLTDSLLTRINYDGGAATHGNAPGPIAAGQTGTIAVTLDTSTAGYSRGFVELAFASHDSDLTDLRLDSKPVYSFGTVNSHAAPVFLYRGHALNYDASAGEYLLNLGRLSFKQQSIKGLRIGNLVSGPADVLSGMVSNGLYFQNGISLASTFAVGPLNAGKISHGIDLAINPFAGGQSQYGVFDFNGVGTNASDPIGEARFAQLVVFATFGVPEPGAVVLFGLGTIGLMAHRRRLAMRG
jgi:hypothetical protein